MKAKLIKIDPHYFLIVDGKTFGSTMEPLISASIRHALSLKNCQAIERGYDLDAIADELAFKHDDRFTLALFALRRGMELMGDKKFSEADVISMIEKSRETGLTAEYLILNNQQTEWDVEIEMEDINPVWEEANVQGHVVCKKCGEWHEAQITPYKCKCVSKPKLYADGCLILKRV